MTDYLVEHQAPPGQAMFEQTLVRGAHAVPRVGESVEVDGLCMVVIAVLHVARTPRRAQSAPVVRLK